MTRAHAPLPAATVKDDEHGNGLPERDKHEARQGDSDAVLHECPLNPSVGAAACRVVRARRVYEQEARLLLRPLVLADPGEFELLLVGQVRVAFHFRSATQSAHTRGWWTRKSLKGGTCRPAARKHQASKP